MCPASAQQRATSAPAALVTGKQILTRGWEGEELGGEGRISGQGGWGAVMASSGQTARHGAAQFSPDKIAGRDLAVTQGVPLQGSGLSPGGKG